MAARHQREQLEARARAGGGDPRYTQVPADLLKRQEYERRLRNGGPDPRYGN
jgi:hypothetical protein